MPRPSQTFAVRMVDGNGKAVLDLADTSKLLAGDEVEWISGKLDVTITFGENSIFGQPDLKMPPDVASKRLTVLDSAPQSAQRSYEAQDNTSGQAFRRLGQQPAAHPVMIFGP